MDDSSHPMTHQSYLCVLWMERNPEVVAPLPNGHRSIVGDEQLRWPETRDDELTIYGLREGER